MNAAHFTSMAPACLRALLLAASLLAPATQYAAAGPTPELIKLETKSTQQFEGLIARAFFNAMYSDEQIDELERVARKFRSEATKTPTGEWWLSGFYDGIMADGNDRRLHDMLDRWSARWPQSPTPHVFRAQLKLLAITGQNSVIDVAHRDPQTREVDPAKVEALRTYLNSRRDIGHVDPHWYVLMVRAAALAYAEEPVIRGLVVEGVSWHPSYTALHDAGTDYFVSSDRRDFEEWARLLEARTSESGSRGAYALAYWRAFNARYRWKLGSNALMNGEHFEQSATDLLKAYPAVENVSRMAVLACAAEDRGATKRLFARGAEPVSFYPWSSNELRESCLRWARAPFWEVWADWICKWLMPTNKAVANYRRLVGFS